MEEASDLSEQSYLDIIAAAYTDDPTDAEATREEASLQHSRRRLLRRNSARLAAEELIKLPPPVIEEKKSKDLKS